MRACGGCSCMIEGEPARELDGRPHVCPQPEPREETKEQARRVFRAALKVAVEELASERHDIAFIRALMVEGIAQALLAAHARGRAEGLEEAAKVAEKGMPHMSEGVSTGAYYRGGGDAWGRTWDARNVADAIRALSGPRGGGA